MEQKKLHGNHHDVLGRACTFDAGRRVGELGKTLGFGRAAQRRLHQTVVGRGVRVERGSGVRRMSGRTDTSLLYWTRVHGRDVSVLRTRRRTFRILLFDISTQSLTRRFRSDLWGGADRWQGHVLTLPLSRRRGRSDRLLGVTRGILHVFFAGRSAVDLANKRFLALFPSERLRRGASYLGRRTHQLRQLVVRNPPFQRVLRQNDTVRVQQAIWKALGDRKQAECTFGWFDGVLVSWVLVAFIS